MLFDINPIFGFTSQSNDNKNNNGSWINLKALPQQMKPYMKQKTNHRVRKMFANDATDKGLISKIYKQLTELNRNKTKQMTQSKNGQKT